MAEDKTIAITDSDDIDELKEEIARRIEQLNRGESALWDTEALKAEGRKLRSQRLQTDAD